MANYSDAVRDDPAAVPYVRVRRGSPFALADDEVDDFMASCEGRWEKPTYFDDKAKSGDFDTVQADFSTDAAVMVANRLCDTVEAVNASVWNFALTDLSHLAANQYPPGTGIAWHLDRHAGVSDRKLSVIVGVDAADEGGVLQFQLGRRPESVLLERGEVVIFPSWLAHRVTKVKAGTRRTIIAWTIGPPWR